MRMRRHHGGVTSGVTAIGVREARLSATLLIRLLMGEQLRRLTMWERRQGGGVEGDGGGHEGVRM